MKLWTGKADAKAPMSTSAINDLPDSDFAYIEPGGKKVGGKTEPRSLRHFPIHDAAHVRNALARLSQSPFGSKARAKVVAAAKRFGVDVSAGKAHSRAASDAARGAGLLQGLYDLAACEADEPEQLAQINDAIDCLSQWMRMERMEIGTAADLEEAAMMEAGVAYPLKAWTEPVKAEELATDQLDLWLAGKRSRRILVVPFGGPLPGGKAGLDLDGEYFDEETDLYGRHPGLRSTRERLVDWHHDQMYGGQGDPTGVMKGAILGRIVLDESPESDGVWADFWANAGESRRRLIAELEERGVPLFGSSQAYAPDVRRGKGGHIEVWPLVRHTLTTSPQNTYAVVPPIKALLGEANSGALSVDALRSALLSEAINPLQTLLEGRDSAGTGGSRHRQALSIALDALSREIATWSQPH